MPKMKAKTTSPPASDGPTFFVIEVKVSMATYAELLWIEQTNQSPIAATASLFVEQAAQMHGLLDDSRGWAQREGWFHPQAKCLKPLPSPNPPCPQPT